MTYQINLEFHGKTKSEQYKKIWMRIILEK